MKRPPDELEQQIIGDVLHGGRRRGVSVQWTTVEAYRRECRRWMLQGIDLLAMRVWVEQDGQRAFDMLVEELLERTGVMVEAYVQAGMKAREQALAKMVKWEAAQRAGREKARKQKLRARDKKAKKWEVEVRRLHKLRGWGPAAISNYLKERAAEGHSGLDANGPSRKLVEHILARSGS